MNISITIKNFEFDFIEKKRINIISRTINKYWRDTLFEALLDKEDNLFWKLKEPEYIVFNAHLKKNKKTLKVKCDSIKFDEKTGKISIVFNHGKFKKDELGSIEVFGKNYKSTQEVKKNNQITQITNLLDLIDGY